MMPEGPVLRKIPAARVVQLRDNKGMTFRAIGKLLAQEQKRRVVYHSGTCEKVYRLYKAKITRRKAGR